MINRSVMIEGPVDLNGCNQKIGNLQIVDL